MAYAVELTLTIGSDISTAEFPGIGVSLTYRLERSDTDMVEVITAKVAEAVRGYQLASQEVRAAGARNEEKSTGSSEPLAAEPDEPLSPAQESALRALLSRDNRSEEGIAHEMKSRFGVAAFEQLSARQANCWLLELQRLERARAQHKTTPNNRSNGRSP